MKANQSNNKNNICGRQIHLIRTGKYDKQHEKISQDLLAARLQVAGLDIDRTAISRIESGGRFLNDFEVVLFAKVLKVPFEVLFNTNTNDNKFHAK